MKLNVVYTDGAIAPGMKAYAVLPAAKLYGGKWQQTRKMTDLCVKEVIVLRISSMWNIKKREIYHQIDIFPLGYKDSLAADEVDCMYKSYMAILGVNLFDTKDEAEAATARFRQIGMSKPVLRDLEYWFEDKAGNKLLPR